MANTVKRLNLSDAIKALPWQPVVSISVWIPAEDNAANLPGFVQGAWGPWVQLARPYTISKDDARTRIMLPGGDEYTRALSVYCTTGQPIELVQPSQRTARVRVDSEPDAVYRVMEIRTWESVSDHAEIHCTWDLGEAQVQA